MPGNISHDEALEVLKKSYIELLHAKGDTPASMSPEAIKTAMKDAFKELLDEKAQQFGYFSFKWAATFIIGGIITYFGIRYGFK